MLENTNQISLKFAMPKFSFSVLTIFTISKENLLHLQQVALRHYDGTCQAAGQPGGFIYGWINMLYDKDEVECTATFKQLDLCTKILECESWVKSDIKLNEAFITLIQSASEISKKVNKV
jgi:hypothetical protein